MTKALPLLAALALCCCMATVNAFPRQGCRCLWTILHPVPFRVIKKIEMTPISGHCRQTETILTRKNGSKVCVNPTDTWFTELLSKLQKKNVASIPTTVSPSASRISS